MTISTSDFSRVFLLEGRLEPSIFLPCQCHFLNVSYFNFIKWTFRPNKKPNNNLGYTNVSFNHSPNMIKCLPISGNNLLSRNSSNKEILDKTKEDYEKVKSTRQIRL